MMDCVKSRLLASLALANLAPKQVSQIALEKASAATQKSQEIWAFTCSKLRPLKALETAYKGLVRTGLQQTRRLHPKPPETLACEAGFLRRLLGRGVHQRASTPPPILEAVSAPNRTQAKPLRVAMRLRT